MSQRRVRLTGRQVYGRAEALRRPTRSKVRRPAMSQLQRRLLVLVVLLGGLAYGLWHAFAVKQVVVKAPGRVGEIQAETEHLMQAAWYQRNVLTLDDGELVSKLQQADPLLRGVEVRRHWPNGITVTVTLKQPSLGWSTGNQWYLLDRDGAVIGLYPADSKLPIVVDGSNLPVQIGARVSSTHFVAFVGQLVPALSISGIGVTSLDVKDTTLDLTVSTNKGYRLLFDTGREVGDEMADLKAVQTLLSAQHKAPAEYIDLRVAGKAYYR